MKKPTATLFSLQQLVVDLAMVHRNHHLSGSERSENDVEHSFAVALLCWYIVDAHKINLDMTKVFKYAIVHDFAERYAGDVNTYASQADRNRKVKLEKAALARLSIEFSNFGDLVKVMNEYEGREDEESIFVWTVDKIQALVLADMDGWRPYKKIDIKYDAFVNKHTEQLKSASPYCKEIFEALLEYFKSTFYDRPK